ncbi:MAG: DUF6101 family protein [Stappiaceae bacterium]
MRRQTEYCGAPDIGSSRTKRLDPSILPQQFSTSQIGLDLERSVNVHLSRDRVMMTFDQPDNLRNQCLPVAHYLGVAVKILPASDTDTFSVVLELRHEVTANSIPLMHADSMEDVVADWQLWGRQLRLPLLLEESDGALLEVAGRLDVVQMGSSMPRRGASSVRQRRPRFLCRRKTGLQMPRLSHAGEHEIIART